MKNVVCSSKNIKALRGEIAIPADKSISHRAAMIASLASGISVIKNFSLGADCLSTLKVLTSLGIKSEFQDEKNLLIDSKLGFLKSLYPLDCGNSGTTMRLMAGILSGQGFDSILTGDESLSKRPMARIVKPLELMGAKIATNQSKAPLEIFASKLKGIDYVSELASAQVKSSVLLAGLHAEGKTSFTEPYISRNHTERMLEFFGANISFENNKTTIEKSEFSPTIIQIPGDISSAAFFIVAALIVPDSEIIIRNVGLNPTRTGILDVIKIMGAEIEILNQRLVSNEEVGDLKIKNSALKGITIGGEIIPRVIDELPIIAVLATQAEGKTIVKDAGDLRNKESDRIKAIVSELKKLGANIEETSDGFIVEGKTSLLGGCEVETYHDHRLAMSLYVAGLVCKKSVLIKEFDWVNISFPEFEHMMSTLGCNKA